MRVSFSQDFNAGMGDDGTDYGDGPIGNFADMISVDTNDTEYQSFDDEEEEDGHHDVELEFEDAPLPCSVCTPTTIYALPYNDEDDEPFQHKSRPSWSRSPSASENHKSFKKGKTKKSRSLSPEGRGESKGNTREDDWVGRTSHSAPLTLLDNEDEDSHVESFMDFDDDESFGPKPLVKSSNHEETPRRGRSKGRSKATNISHLPKKTNPKRHRSHSAQGRKVFNDRVLESERKTCHSAPLNLDDSGDWDNADSAGVDLFDFEDAFPGMDSSKRKPKIMTKLKESIQGMVAPSSVTRTNSKGRVRDTTRKFGNRKRLSSRRGLLLEDCKNDEKCRAEPRDEEAIRSFSGQGSLTMEGYTKSSKKKGRMSVQLLNFGGTKKSGRYLAGKDPAGEAFQDDEENKKSRIGSKGRTLTRAISKGVKRMSARNLFESEKENQRANKQTIKSKVVKESLAKGMKMMSGRGLAAKTA